MVRYRGGWCPAPGPPVPRRRGRPRGGARSAMPLLPPGARPELEVQDEVLVLVLREEVRPEGRARTQWIAPSRTTKASCSPPREGDPPPGCGRRRASGPRPRPAPPPARTRLSRWSASVPDPAWRTWNSTPSSGKGPASPGIVKRAWSRRHRPSGGSVPVAGRSRGCAGREPATARSTAGRVPGAGVPPAQSIRRSRPAAAGSVPGPPERGAGPISRVPTTTRSSRSSRSRASSTRAPGSAARALGEGDRGLRDRRAPPVEGDRDRVLRHRGDWRARTQQAGSISTGIG